MRPVITLDCLILMGIRIGPAKKTKHYNKNKRKIFKDYKTFQK